LYILYGIKVYLLTLLKISYGIGIHLLCVVAVMALIMIVTGDKAVFTKQLLRLRRYIYG